MSRFMLVYVHPDLGEQRFELRPGVTYRLGSRSSADVVIPQRDVSRNHALLRVGNHTLSITDLESKNGTYVNGKRVTSAEFLPGDRLQLSSAELVVLEISSGDFALAKEVAPAGPRPSDSESRDDTLQVQRETEPEDIVALMEDVADYLEHRGLAVLLHRVVQRFGLRSIMVFFRDPGGRLALVGSSGELPDVGTFFEAFQDHLPGETGASGASVPPVRRLSLGNSVFLAAPLQEGYWLVLGCDASVPSITDIRAMVAASRFMMATREMGRPPEGDGVQTSTGSGDPLERILGNSRAIETCRKLALQFAKQDEPVLITGESGTGKELFARAIHEMSRRRNGPFVAVNCAAIPPDLTEAELFGVAPGAATGVSERPGRFHAARGGTLFLDEIGELPRDLQAKLLRVLEQGELYRVGDDTPVSYDVRIVSATNRRIEEAVERGEFRADLFYRLHVLHLHVPPLRDHRNDIPILVNAFLKETSLRMDKRIAGITVRALDMLKAWRWPGNVRELRSEVVRMAAMVTSGAVIDVDQVSSEIQGGVEQRIGASLEALLDLPLKAAREELERRLILRMLEETGGNQSRAAERLGISRAGLFKKVRHLGI